MSTLVVFGIIWFIFVIAAFQAIYKQTEQAEQAKKAKHAEQIRENNTIQMLKFKEIFKEYYIYHNAIQKPGKINWTWWNKFNELQKAVDNMFPIVESFNGNYDWNRVGCFPPPMWHVRELE